MDPLNIIQYSCATREGMIPTAPQLPKLFTGINNQEWPNVFDTSTLYTLWDSGFAHSINTYFKFYTECKPLEKEDDT